ncbi:MAG: helicase [Myxococcaceae bacterium]|nr:MAG: helicase [Myxococcaceae bacterium]
MPVDLASLQALLANVRRRSPSMRLAQAAELARPGNVLSQRETDDEAMLLVQVPGWSVPATAMLYPEEGEWACDCGGADPCAHVVAAAAALETALRTGVALPSAVSVQSRLRYALTATREGLRVARYITGPGGDERALEGALSDAGVALSTGDADLAVDRLCDLKRGGLVAAQDLPALLTALSSCEDVSLDGRAVRVSTEEVLPKAWVEDHPKGFALRIERDPAVTAVLSPGVADAGGVLRPMGATDLSGPLLEKLPRTRVFAATEVSELVLKTLPELSARLPVELRTKRLPPLVKGLRPRITMDVTLLSHALSVTPSLTYGDPPIARIEEGRMVHLRGGLPLRDEGAEVREVHRLRDELGLVPGVRTAYRGADAARFLAKLKAWSPEGGSATASLFGSVPVAPKLTVRDTGFDLSFELPGDGEGEGATPRQADAATVMQAWREGLDVVPLTDGTWAPLPVEWLRAHGHRVADLLAARGDDGEVTRAALPALAQLCEALETPAPPKLQGLRALAEGFEAIPPAALPEDLTATLRPYQRRGVDWLCFLRDAQMGAVLADDMGLGKTLQTICALRGRSLVVAPRSVLHNWADEVKRFRPGLSVAVYHGAGRAIDRRADVTLTTYAVLRLDAGALSREPWDAVVLDEAQAIKNPDSQAARAAYQLRGSFRVALSGTPVENRLEELWSLMHFANPGLLGGRSDFDERYAKPAAEGDGTAMARLRQRVGTFLLRRLKREVAPELPPRTEAVLHCDLDEREREVYDAVRAASQRDVVEALREGGSTLLALEALLRLRQAACHSGLVPGQSADSSSKVTCLVDALESAAADGHKALVFSQWTSLLDRVEPHLEAAGIGFARLDGSTRDRAEVVGRFQSEGGPPVMLVSLKAGGTGINLTAADHVFLLDPWWNPAVEDQAADRAHRIGQQRPVTIYRIVASDTVEERIVALQSRKRALAEAALSGGDPSASLTRDDLLALLA